MPMSTQTAIQANGRESTLCNLKCQVRRMFGISLCIRIASTQRHENFAGRILFSAGLQ